MSTNLSISDQIGTSVVNYSGLVNMNLFSSDVQTVIDNKFFQVLYNFEERFVTTTINNVEKKYKTKSFYIYGLLHTITGLTDQLQDVNGEFIIENVSTEDNSKLYLCFLLQSIRPTDSPTNDPKNGLLSQFFNNLVTDGAGTIIYKGNTSVNKNIQIGPYNDDTISQQTKCITYFDSANNATVVIYTNPVTYNTIQNNSINFKRYLSGLDKTTKLFNVQPKSSSDKIDNRSTGSSSNSSSTDSNSNFNIDNDNIYIDCNPTGESEESIKTYKLPINSNLMNDIQKSSVSTLISNFAMFSILLIVCYVGIPQLYNAAVCKKNMDDKDEYNSRIFIFVYFAIVIFTLFIQVSVNHDMNELLAGFFFMFLAVLTYILVLDNGTSDGEFDIKSFVVFIFGILNHLFNPRQSSTIYLILFFIFMVLISSLLMKDSDGNIFASTDKGKIAISWISILVIPTISGLITWTTM